jgi:TetR/AcrR family transcriptional repressor of nem operon
MSTRGRKRAFEETGVVEAVMDVFWRKGFDATSYDDLVATTGVNRHSLYQVLGNKDAALTRALDCYLEKVSALTAPLRADTAGIREIRNHFARVIALNRADPRGCLVCKLAVGPEMESPENRERVRRMFDLLDTGFRHALLGARRRGEIATKQDISSLSAVLLAAIIAISTLVQIPGGLARAESVASGTLDLLK